MVRISCESRKSDKVFSVHESRVLVLTVIREKERERVGVGGEGERKKEKLAHFSSIIILFLQNY